MVGADHIYEVCLQGRKQKLSYIHFQKEFVYSTPSPHDQQKKNKKNKMKGQTHIRVVRSSSRMWAPPPSSKLNHLVRFWMLMGIHLNSRVLTIHLKKVTSSPQSSLMLMVGGLIPPHFIHGCCVCCLSHYLGQDRCCCIVWAWTASTH